MKRLLIIIIVGMMLGGCVTRGPVVSKSRMGNLKINVQGPEEMAVNRARLYLDDLPVGNVSPYMPVLHVKRGLRVVRVELEGCKVYEQEIFIFGAPNHQVLNIVLEEK